MIVTPCGGTPNSSDCMMCLRMHECKEACAAICRGCTREYLCPLTFKRKRSEEGYCRGLELING